jgi:predicted dehydrogenase
MHIASRDADKANSFINEYCSKSSVEVVVKGGDDAYAQIIEGDLCDAVYIPLPTTLHKEWVTRALQAGKHVLVEKPVAVTYEDYVEMRQVAFACRKFIMDGTMFVHNPRTDKFLQCVTDENVFGDIDRIDFTFTFTGRAGFFENDIRVKVDGDPLGCIGDLVRNRRGAIKYLLPCIVSVCLNLY